MSSTAPLTIAIAGMGFSGMMTAVHLMRNAQRPVHLHLIDPCDSIGRGVAYSTSTQAHLLNVAAGRMSAYQDKPNDFLDYVCRQPSYQDIQPDILERAFLPRALYGDYLDEVWRKAMGEKHALITIEHVRDRAIGIEKEGSEWAISLASGGTLRADKIVIATGNELPANPPIGHPDFFASPRYFRNPWSDASTDGADKLRQVLIVGNGLTMVDTVLSLLEKGFKGQVISISPHGYIMLPHRFAGVVYKGLKEEMKEPYEMGALFRLFRKHIERIRTVGLSAEPVVDSIRSISQEVWLKLSEEDRRRFMAHLRHLWGVARHRLPAHIYDLIQELKADGRLTILRARLLDAEETPDGAKVTLVHLPDKRQESLQVDRVINCTGPRSDVSQTENPLLRNLFAQGLLQPDPLKLGIHTNLAGALIHTDGATDDSLYTLGSHLRGLLWESTAVPELRVQAERLAGHLLGS